MEIRTLLIIIISAFLGGCTVHQQSSLTPLEIQSMQTRSYEQSKRVVFASVMSVLQDLGYTIQSADFDTGFISAEGMSRSSGWDPFYSGFGGVNQTRATAFIEEINKFTQVRLNFVEKREYYYPEGQRSRNDSLILESNIYQNAFERIEDAVFIRSGDQ